MTNARYTLGKIATPTGVGLPVNVKVAAGPLTVSGVPRVDARVYTVLPAIAVDVPAGKNLYITVAPVAYVFAGQRGPLPGALLLKDTSSSVHRTLSR